MSGDISNRQLIPLQYKTFFFRSVQNGSQSSTVSTDQWGSTLNIQLLWKRMHWNPHTNMFPGSRWTDNIRKICRMKSVVVCWSMCVRCTRGPNPRSAICSYTTTTTTTTSTTTATTVRAWSMVWVAKWRNATVSSDDSTFLERVGERLIKKLWHVGSFWPENQTKATLRDFNWLFYWISYYLN